MLHRSKIGMICNTIIVNMSMSGIAGVKSAESNTMTKIALRQYLY